MPADSPFPPGGADMWEPEQFTPPLGGYPTRERPQAGFQAAERTSEQGTSVGVSEENGCGHNSPSTAQPAPLAGVSAATICQNCGFPFREHVSSGKRAGCTFAPPIWPPDEWDMLARIEKLERTVANQEHVIAMCVQVATRAAEDAKQAGNAVDSADTVIQQLAARIAELESKLADLLPALR